MGMPPLSQTAHLVWMPPVLLSYLGSHVMVSCAVSLAVCCRFFFLWIICRNLDSTTLRCAVFHMAGFHLLGVWRAMAFFPFVVVERPCFERVRPA